LRAIVKRTHAAGIRDAPALINDVDAFRPRGIGVVRSVSHFVDSKRNRIFLALHKIIGDGHPLLESFRLRVTHIFFYVGFHLPLVGGVRFADIHGQEVGVVFVVLVDLDDVADLATKGRSSVAAEDHHERTAGTGALSQLKVIFTV